MSGVSGRARGAPGVALSLPRTADGRPILARADLDAYDRPQRSGGRERYYCPIHGGDHQRSLSVDPVSGAYTCFTCGAKGVLRDHWPEKEKADGNGSAARRGAPPPPPSVEEIGRRELERRARVDAGRAARLAGDTPAHAATFLQGFDALNVALRDRGSPGAAYLRGLDPALAVSLGAGYAAPNTWPGDRGRKVGRLVYPLADPATGRVVSALGRLCVDADPAWPDGVRADFARVKQRKLAGCPAGVWPYVHIAAATERRRPLVLVEGPADALALLRHVPDGPDGGEGLDIVALLGTANVLPAALLRGLPGVVMALDGDGSGVKAMRELRAELAIAGGRVEVLPADWLGGAKDAGELAAAVVATGTSDEAAAMAMRRYEEAVGAVRMASRCLANVGWDDDAAGRLLTDFHARCAAAYNRLPKDGRQELVARLDQVDAAINEAYAARDWDALNRAVATCEPEYEIVSHPRMC